MPGSRGGKRRRKSAAWKAWVDEIIWTGRVVDVTDEALRRVTPGGPATGGKPVAEKDHRKHDKPTNVPLPSEVERDRADPTPEGFVPETLRLPYTGRLDVEGRTVEEVAEMIRDSRDAFDRGDNGPAAGSHPDSETGGDVSDVSLFDDMAEGTVFIMGPDDGHYPGFIVMGATHPPEPETTSPGRGPSRKREQSGDARLPAPERAVQGEPSNGRRQRRRRSRRNAGR